MSGPGGHERETDPAALDELVRAFTDEREDTTAPSDESKPQIDDGDGGGQTQPVPPEVPAWAIDDDAEPPAADEQAPVLIVEATPIDVSPPAPKIIRIDDYSGSVAIEDLPTTPGATPPPPAAVPAAHGDPVVIAIEDEDLPDAVYVEGSLDRSDSRSIVFIQDDDTDDALVPESERDVRRGIEPRMRERRVAVKRAQGRRRLKWVLLACVVVFIVVGTLAVLGSGLFAIREDQVFVTGTVYTDAEQLQVVIDDLVGTPVLVADTQAAERQLEAIPWVETARVRTDFPHGVSIEIRERKAIATYQGPDQRFRVLDRHGRVLDVIDNYPFAYVLLGGPDPVDLEPGQFAPYGYAAAADLGKNLTGSVRGRVHLIEVTANGSRLVLHIDDGVQVNFGEARDLLVKLVRLETVLSTGDALDSSVIDVSTNQVTL